MLKRGLGCLLGALMLAGTFSSAAQGERPYQAVYLEVFKTENRQFTTGARLLVVEGDDEGHQARTIDFPSAFVRPESFVLDHLVSDDLRYVLLFQYSSAPLNAGAYDLHSLTLVDLESAAADCCRLIDLPIPQDAELDPQLDSVRFGDVRFSSDGVPYATLSYLGTYGFFAPEEFEGKRFGGIVTLELSTGAIVQNFPLDERLSSAAANAPVQDILLGEWVFAAGQSFTLSDGLGSGNESWSYLDPFEMRVCTPVLVGDCLMTRMVGIPPPPLERYGGLLSRLANGETLYRSRLPEWFVYDRQQTDERTPHQVRYLTGSTFNVPAVNRHRADEAVVYVTPPQSPAASISNLTWAGDGEYWVSLASLTHELIVHEREGRTVRLGGLLISPYVDSLIGTPQGWLLIDEGMLKHFTYDSASHQIGSEDVFSVHSRTQTQPPLPSIIRWVSGPVLGQAAQEARPLAAVQLEQVAATATAYALSQLPTATLNPTPGPTATPDAACAGYLPPRLVIGQLARVLPSDPNRLRAQPQRSAEQVGVLEVGVPFEVLEGPICSEGITWWRVQRGSFIGWTAESDSSSYFVEPLLPPTSTPQP